MSRPSARQTDARRADVPQMGGFFVFTGKRGEMPQGSRGGMPTRDVLAEYRRLGVMPISGGSDADDGDDASGDGDGKAKGDDAGGDGKPKDSNADEAAGLKSALEKERKTARDLSRDLKSVRDELDKLKGKDKSDVERLTGDLEVRTKELDAAKARVRETQARSAVVEAATKINAVSARAVYALIRDDIDYDDEGEPTNVDALLKKAKVDEPHLFRKTPGNGDANEKDESVKDDDMNARIRRAAGRGRP